jgi:hypothetical protein
MTDVPPRWQQLLTDAIERYGAEEYRRGVDDALRPPPPPPPPAWDATPLPEGFSLQNPLFWAHEDALHVYAEFAEGAVKPVRVRMSIRRGDTSEEHDQEDPAISRWPGYVSSIQGSCIMLRPEEDWVIRWVIEFDDATLGVYIWPLQWTRPARMLTDLAAVPVSRWCDQTVGVDTNLGTTAEAPWDSYHHAVVKTPRDGHLRIRAGYYVSQFGGALGRDGAITISAEGRVIVEPPTRTSPAGSGLTNAGVWVLTPSAPDGPLEADPPGILRGPGRFGNTPGTVYRLWKWTGSPITAGTGLTGTWRTTRNGRPRRLHHHARDTNALATPAHFAEFLYTNKRFRYGFFAAPNGDLFCRVPPPLPPADPLDPGLDPNTLFMTFTDGTTYGFYPKSGGPSRINGVTFIGFDRAILANAAGTIVDHCTTQCNRVGVYVNGHGSLVVDNLLEDADQAQEVPDHATIDWGAVKSAGIMADGTAYGAKIAGSSESAACKINTARGAEFRRNRIHGTFNGLTGAQAGPGPTSRLYSFATIATDNTFTFVADDAVEPEGAALCWVALRNRFEKCLVALSLGPVDGGPVIFDLNELWMNGGAYIGRLIDGTISPAGKIFLKFSSQSEPQAPLYKRHNTAYATGLNPGGQAPPYAGDSAGGSTSAGFKVHEYQDWSGNLLLVAGDVINEISEQRPEWRDNHNFYCTLSRTGGLKIAGTTYNNTSPSTTVEAMRAAVKQGEFSNRVGGTTYQMNGEDAVAFFRSQFVDGPAGDLRLVADSPLRGIVPPSPVTARRGQRAYDVGARP